MGCVGLVLFGCFLFVWFPVRGHPGVEKDCVMVRALLSTPQGGTFTHARLIRSLTHTLCDDLARATEA